jgi:hypothetical protein
MTGWWKGSGVGPSDRAHGRTKRVGHAPGGGAAVGMASGLQADGRVSEREWLRMTERISESARVARQREALAKGREAARRDDDGVTVYEQRKAQQRALWTARATQRGVVR